MSQVNAQQFQNSEMMDIDEGSKYRAIRKCSYCGCTGHIKPKCYQRKFDSGINMNTIAIGVDNITKRIIKNCVTMEQIRDLLGNGDYDYYFKHIINILLKEPTYGMDFYSKHYRLTHYYFNIVKNHPQYESRLEKYNRNKERLAIVQVNCEKLKRDYERQLRILNETYSLRNAPLVNEMIYLEKAPNLILFDVKLNLSLLNNELIICPICIEEFPNNSNIVFTNCNGKHGQCRECTIKLIEKNTHPKCPLCRDDITQIICCENELYKHLYSYYNI